MLFPSECPEKWETEACESFFWKLYEENVI